MTDAKKPEEPSDEDLVPDVGMPRSEYLERLKQRYLQQEQEKVETLRVIERLLPRKKLVR